MRSASDRAHHVNALLPGCRACSPGSVGPAGRVAGWTRSWPTTATRTPGTCRAATSGGSRPLRRTGVGPEQGVSEMAASDRHRTSVPTERGEVPASRRGRAGASVVIDATSSRCRPLPGPATIVHTAWSLGPLVSDVGTSYLPRTRAWQQAAGGGTSGVSSPWAHATPRACPGESCRASPLREGWCDGR
jgi:hypothetical protein